MKSYLTIAVLVLGCEAGSDGDAGSDVGMDSARLGDGGSDCGARALAGSGEIPCGTVACGVTEACCVRAPLVPGACTEASCISRGPDYSMCDSVRECDGRGAAACPAGEGCCVLGPDRPGLCVGLASTCERWLCSPGGAPCPVGTECAMVDLEGTFGCVEVMDGGTDTGP